MRYCNEFTFVSYKIDKFRSVITFTYRAKFFFGITQTFTDRLFLHDVSKEMWEKVPEVVLEKTLRALLIMLGINYWCVFPTKNIKIRDFSITEDEAKFWNELYLKGLGEFFYDMKMDFRDLISFPFDKSVISPLPININLDSKALLLNGAGKDSILSAEILKKKNAKFDFFAFAPTPAHKRVASLVGAKTITATRKTDPWMNQISALWGVSSSYPSVSTFTFVAVLLAELLGYNEIIFSNEKSADFGNLTYLGLEVNHQWCKSSEAEKLINNYIKRYITTDISTKSLLREFSELEIVKQFVNYPKYLPFVTSCNSYFWLPRIMQLWSRKGYWCKRCPKCVFLFACFSAFLPKNQIIEMFGDNLYNKPKLLPLYRRILGIEGFKPLDCVGEPEEMILAMHYASLNPEWQGELAIELFKERFPNYNFEQAKQRIFQP